MADYITRIKKSIAESDIKKTKQLLKQLKDYPYNIKSEVLQAFALASDMVALNLLGILAEDKHLGREIYDRVVQLLIDRAHLNSHFILILYDICDNESIGQIVPLMKHLLSREADFEILKETIKAAGKQRIESLVDDIAEFIFYGEEKLKAEAVRALERIDSDSAYDVLLKAADSPKSNQDIMDSIEVMKNRRIEAPGIKQQIKEKKQTKKSLLKNISVWNSQLTAKDIKTRFKGLIQLASVKSDADKIFAENLKTKNHDLIINTLNLISRCIPESLIPTVISLLEEKKIPPAIRFAAHTALGAFPELESAASAINGINSPLMHIRTAAVQVLNKQPTDFVLAEIKEKIESGTEQGKKLGESILDAHADNIIIQLMVSDAFTYILSNYLEKKASFSVLENYIKIQRSRKLAASAKKYEKILILKQKKKRMPVAILTSSEIRGSILAKVLFSAGLLPKIFPNFQQTFESIVQEKPYGVICDLFLEDMTGLDVLHEIRTTYPAEQLPVILVTLQKDLINQEKNIIGFPPGRNQIDYCFKQG